MKSNIIVSFEGIDGCGKTTQARLFCEYLESSGKKAMLLYEPGGTAVSERIRSLLLDKEEKPCIWSEFFLYLASRAQLLSEVIEKKSEEGHIIVLDRYIDSTVAYQGYGRGIPVELIKSIHSHFIKDMLPDITFLIDAEAESLVSILDGKKKDRIEGESIHFQKKVRLGYLEEAMKESDRIKVIKRSDSSGTHNDVKKAWKVFINGRE